MNTLNHIEWKLLKHVDKWWQWFIKHHGWIFPSSKWFSPFLRSWSNPTIHEINLWYWICFRAHHPSPKQLDLLIHPKKIVSCWLDTETSHTFSGVQERPLHNRIRDFMLVCHVYKSLIDWTGLSLPCPSTTLQSQSQQVPRRWWRRPSPVATRHSPNCRPTPR